MAQTSTPAYTLAQTYNRANIQDRLWYVMDTTDLATLKANENIIFGDKVYVIKTKTVYIMGNDNNFYEM